MPIGHAADDHGQHEQAQGDAHHRRGIAVAFGHNRFRPCAAEPDASLLGELGVVVHGEELEYLVVSRPFGCLHLDLVTLAPADECLTDGR